MIAHVAEAGEDRGRVVVQLGPSGQLSETALKAAVHVAEAYRSEIESVFVEDRQLFYLGSFPFSREIPLSGHAPAEMDMVRIARELGLVAAGFHQRVRAEARRCEIGVRSRTVREDVVPAFVQTCAESAPWNVVSLAEPFASAHVPLLAEIFATVHDMTGVVIAGRSARQASGVVYAVIEEQDHVSTMMRLAERLADATGCAARLLVVEADAARLAWLEGHVRLAAGGAPRLGIEVLDMSRCTAGSAAELLRRRGAGFVVARFGGRLASPDGSLEALTAFHDGPLFLVR